MQLCAILSAACSQHKAVALAGARATVTKCACPLARRAVLLITYRVSVLSLECCACASRPCCNTPVERPITCACITGTHKISCSVQWSEQTASVRNLANHCSQGPSHVHAKPAGHAFSWIRFATQLHDSAAEYLELMAAGITWRLMLCRRRRRLLLRGRRLVGRRRRRWICTPAGL